MAVVELTPEIIEAKRNRKTRQKAERARMKIGNPLVCQKCGFGTFAKVKGGNLLKLAEMNEQGEVASEHYEHAQPQLCEVVKVWRKNRLAYLDELERLEREPFLWIRGFFRVLWQLVKALWTRRQSSAGPVPTT